jgi:transcription-repair coupling factor (superfamily II helicase)
MLFIISEISLYAGRLRIQGVQQRRGMLAMTFAEFPAVDPKTLAEIILCRLIQCAI